jgi:hypothetical protein
MALPILDGNQSATTLSTILTGGQHIPAHTVVSLGSQAITDMRGAVSGSVVSISNLPAIQTIAGTVTASLNSDYFDANNDWYAQRVVPHVELAAGEFVPVGTNNSLPISGTVTANAAEAVSIVNTTTVTKADAKFSLIAGANNPTDVAATYQITPLDVDIKGVAFVDGKVVSHRNSCVADLAGQGGPAWKATLVASSVTVGNSVTIGSLPAISGTVTARLNYVADSAVGFDGGPTDLAGLRLGYNSNEGNEFVIVTEDSGLPISGTVTANNPSGALTTRFGSVVTANLATLTSAVTNASRKYLLVQNIATSTVTIGIGFAPTTTQGIQLTAGAGLTFDAFCPTGGVWWLSGVTSSNFCVIEG